MTFGFKLTKKARLKNQTGFKLFKSSPFRGLEARLHVKQPVPFLFLVVLYRFYGVADHIA
jgi:hypothetical protein